MYKWFDFYRRHFPELNSDRVEQNVHCKFHDDKEASCSINLDKGLWYCHACRIGGSPEKFLMKHTGCSFREAKITIYGHDIQSVLDDADVEEKHFYLTQRQHFLKELQEKRGWQEKTVNEYKLGWDTKDERVYIPVYDEEGHLLNIRKYDVRHKHGKGSKFIGIKGHNKPTLFPMDKIFRRKDEPFFLFGGEPDTLLAWQFGLNACTFTGGEGTFDPILLPRFRNSIIYICYDCDAAGRRSSKIIATKIAKYAKEVYRIKLWELKDDLGNPILQETGDFTDLFFWSIDYGNNKNLDAGELFKRYFDDACKQSDRIFYEEEPKAAEEQYKEIKFERATDEEYAKENICFDALVTGENVEDFRYPKKMKITCDTGRKFEVCKKCGMFYSGGEQELEVHPKDILQLIGVPTYQQMGFIKNLTGIQNCSNFLLEKIEEKNVQEIYMTSILDPGAFERTFKLKKGYLLDGHALPNKAYKFYGRAVPHPKSQHVTFIFDQSQAHEYQFDTFKLSKEEIEQLKLFQVDKETNDIGQKLTEIYKDFSYNLNPRLIGREEILFACDLAFYSPLWMNFLGSEERGWVDCLVIGDTQTGKTKTAQKLLAHYKVGESCCLKGATWKGLIGGETQLEGSKIFSWGQLPLNDGRLILLEEASGASEEVFGKLTEVREDGKASRTISGQIRKTLCRTRMIWLSNPKKRQMKFYDSGCQAIRELIIHPEDISRFDFILCVSSDEIPAEEINVKEPYYQTEEIPHTYISELCNKLVLWAWSRRKEHITFTKKAEDLILEYAIEMSKKYDSSFPLVLGSTQRLKLARLSASLAIRLFSTNNGVNVLVKESHVHYIKDWLDIVYNKPVFGYGDYSSMLRESRTTAEIDKVKSAIMELEHRRRFIRNLLNKIQITAFDIEELSGLHKDEATALRKLLVQNNYLDKKAGFYVKTPEFRQFLQKELERKK